MHKFIVSSLYYFVKWLYMFRAIISPSSGTTFNKLYSACTSCTVQLIKCCCWWWTNDSPKHVQPFNEIIKATYKNLCISLVYIHIEIWCTMHTTSNYTSSYPSPVLSHLFLSYSHRCFLPPWASQNVRMRCQICHILITYKTNGHLASFRDEFCRMPVQISLKDTNPGLSQENNDEHVT